MVIGLFESKLPVCRPTQQLFSVASGTAKNGSEFRCYMESFSFELEQHMIRCLIFNCCFITHIPKPKRFQSHFLVDGSVWSWFLCLVNSATLLWLFWRLGLGMNGSSLFNPKDERIWQLWPNCCRQCDFYMTVTWTRHPRPSFTGVGLVHIWRFPPFSS